MKILVLTVLMSFLSQGAFAASGGALAGGARGENTATVQVHVIGLANWLELKDGRSLENAPNYAEFDRRKKDGSNWRLPTGEQDLITQFAPVHKNIKNNLMELGYSSIHFVYHTELCALSPGRFQSSGVCWEEIKFNPGHFEHLDHPQICDVFRVKMQQASRVAQNKEQIRYTKVDESVVTSDDFYFLNVPEWSELGIKKLSPETVITVDGRHFVPTEHEPNIRFDGRSCDSRELAETFRRRVSAYDDSAANDFIFNPFVPGTSVLAERPKLQHLIVDVANIFRFQPDGVSIYEGVPFAHPVLRLGWIPNPIICDIVCNSRLLYKKGERICTYVDRLVQLGFFADDLHKEPINFFIEFPKRLDRWMQEVGHVDFAAKRSVQVAAKRLCLLFWNATSAESFRASLESNAETSKLEQLLEMGFSFEASVRALEASNNDIQTAILHL